MDDKGVCIKWKLRTRVINSKYLKEKAKKKRFLYINFLIR